MILSHIEILSDSTYFDLSDDLDELDRKNGESHRNYI